MSERLEDEMFSGESVTIDDLICELNKVKNKYGNIKCCGGDGEYGADNSISLVARKSNGCSAFAPDLPESEIYLEIWQCGY